MILRRRSGIGSAVLTRPVHGRLFLKAFGFCPMNRCMSMKICLMPIFTGMFMETPSTKTLVANPCVFVLNVSAIGQLPLKIYGEKCWAVKW